MGTRGKTLSSRFLCVALCLAYSARITIGSTAHSGQGRPKAVVTETRFDFGAVFAGEQLIHVFSIRNEGTAPLTLLDKARDTEGMDNRNRTSQQRISYAGAAFPALEYVPAMRLVPVPAEPVPT
jgi:hypothetical protein